MSEAVEANLNGKVLRLDPRRRIATVAVPSVGQGRSFRADYPAALGQTLARVVERCHGFPHQRTAGGVAAVRPTDKGAEVELHITDDTTWQRLATGDSSVAVHCTFAGAVGADPYGGRVQHVELS